MAMFWKDAGWRCRLGRQLGGADLYGLIHLYQPIVGTASIALYMTLASHLPLHRPGVSGIYGHSYLLKLCALTFDELLKARYALEGVGLLNTYEIRDAEQGFFYEYEIIPPLSPARFFQSDVLSMTLCRLLGRERFLELRRELVGEREQKTVSREEWSVNITKTFSEVFDSLSPQELAKSAQLERDELGTVEPEENRFSEGKYPEWDDEDDLSMIRMRLSSVVDDRVWTRELIEELKEIRFLYQLDDWDLLKALQNPYVTRNGQIDLDRLRSFVKNEYRLRFGGPPVVALRKQAAREEEPEQKRDEADLDSLSEEERHFRQLQQISPLELLSYYHHGTRIPDSDVELVETLVRHYGLPSGVINVLLEYVLLRYDYKLPRNLVEKIAGHWKRLGIKTVEAALEQARKETWEPRKKKAEKSGGQAARGKMPQSGKLPSALKKQLGTKETAAAKSHDGAGEEPATRQAEIRAKLKLMNERFGAARKEKENLP
jgi:replication initiation and membrane attachment protein